MHFDNTVQATDL